MRIVVYLFVGGFSDWCNVLFGCCLLLWFWLCGLAWVLGGDLRGLFWFGLVLVVCFGWWFVLFGFD